MCWNTLCMWLAYQQKDQILLRWCDSYMKLLRSGEQFTVTVYYLLVAVVQSVGKYSVYSFLCGCCSTTWNYWKCVKNQSTKCLISQQPTIINASLTPLNCILIGYYRLVHLAHHYSTVKYKDFFSIFLWALIMHGTGGSSCMYKMLYLKMRLILF